MRNPFARQELPPVEDLMTALLSANELLNPQWSKEEVVFNSLRRISEIKSRNRHKKLAIYVNEVCRQANQKIVEVLQLEKQFQLHTDINN